MFDPKTMVAPRYKKRALSWKTVQRRERRWFRKWVQPELEKNKPSSCTASTAPSPDVRAKPTKPPKTRPTRVIGRTPLHLLTMPPLPKAKQFEDPRMFPNGGGGDRKMVRRELYLRHTVCKLFPQETPPVRRKKLLPCLVWGVSGKAWNKKMHSENGNTMFAAAESGVTNHNPGFSDVCLVTSLRALGVDLRYEQDGPFRALKDGNRMVAPHGRALVSTDFGNIRRGQYVKWHAGHFTAVEVGDRVRLVDGARSLTVDSIADLGRPDEHLWFELITGGSRPGVTLGQLAVIEQQRARASLKRQLHQERARITARKTSHCTPEQLSTIAANRHEAQARQRAQLTRPSPPLLWAHPTIPDAPVDFSSLPTLPDVNFLAVLNSHPRDAGLVFYPDTHTYFIHGRRSNGSVTGLIHAYANAFDSVRTIERMIGGANWPRPGYLARCIAPDVMQLLRAIPKATQLVELLNVEPVCEVAVCREAQAVAKLSLHCRNVVGLLALTPRQIEAKWEDNRVRAAGAGTWMHWCFEAWINRVPIPEDSQEFQLFRAFTHTLGGLTAFRTEWTIYGDEEWLAGSIDFVAEDSDGTLVLFDWKRSKDRIQHNLCMTVFFRTFLRTHRASRAR